MAGHGAGLGLRGPLADHDLRPHEALAASTRAGTRHAQRASRSQAGRKLTAQRSTTLHVERLVDRLVRDPHRGIIGKVNREPVRDLLGAPRSRPATILPTTVAPADPAHPGSRDARAVRGRDRPREPLLHVPPQRLVRRELGRPRTTRAPIGVPLRRRGAVVERATAGRGVPTQLARDRRRRTPKPPRDLPHSRAAHAKQRDLFPLAERQVASRRRPQADRSHPATLAEPPDADRRRHARRPRRLLARAASRDRPPEPLPLLPPPHRRPTRRPHPRPPRTIRRTTPNCSHRNPPHRGVARTT